MLCRILEDMGVMQELVDANEAQFANSGGFVSPSGLSYIGAHPCCLSSAVGRLAQGTVQLLLSAQSVLKQA